MLSTRRRVHKDGRGRAGRVGAAAALLTGLLIGASASRAVAAPCAGVGVRAPLQAQGAVPYCAHPYEAELTQDGTIYRTAVDVDGNDVDLALDVWEPIGDPAGEVRPVLLWMHGGFFEFGSRRDNLDVFEDFAGRGFVVVSIDYRKRRLPPSGGLAVPTPEAVADTLDDAVAAVAWIHANAADLRIDRGSVIASGYSAGAITALGLAHKDTAVSAAASDNPIAAAVSFSGLDLHGAPPHRDDDVPVLMYNGDQDTIVPLGAAQNSCRNTAATGSECDLVVVEGGEHSPGDPERYQQAVSWLAAHGVQQLAACDRFDVPAVVFPTVTTSTTPAVTTPTTTAPLPPAVEDPTAAAPVPAPAPAAALPGTIAYTG